MANPRDVDLTIVGHDHTELATRKAAANLDRLKRKADEVARSNNKVGKSGQMAGAQIAAGFVRAAAVIRSAGPVAALALVAAAISVLPTVAAAAGTGIVLGLGGAIAGIGIAFAAQNERVKASFSRLKSHVVTTLKTMSDVFEPVLLGISQDMERTFDGFAPFLSQSFSKLAPVVGAFARNFLDALNNLKPGLSAVVSAFEVVANQVGPKLPGLMAAISSAFINIANAIAANPAAIDTVMNAISGAITFAGRLVGGLIRMNAYLGLFTAGFQAKMLAVKAALAGVAVKASDTVADILEAFAKIPGPIGAAFKNAAASARTAANNMQGKLDKINTDKAKADVAVMRARLTVLGNMKPTPKVTAEIAGLKAKLAAAQAAINAVQGRNVDIWIRTHRQTYYGTSGQKPPTNPHGDSAGGVSFMRTAPGGNYRTGGPAPAGAGFTANTYVTLDGREIAAAVRTVIDQATGRQSFRARSGRR